MASSLALEKYLGTGTEEDMRKEADNLKEKFGGGATAPNRQQPGKASDSDAYRCKDHGLINLTLLLSKEGNIAWQ